MKGGYKQYSLRGKPCSEAEYIKWLESIGGECPTQPLPVFYENGLLKGMVKHYGSKWVRVKNGRVVVEDK